LGSSWRKSLARYNGKCCEVFCYKKENSFKGPVSKEGRQEKEEKKILKGCRSREKRSKNGKTTRRLPKVSSGSFKCVKKVALVPKNYLREIRGGKGSRIYLL